jgi:hypothetical protein
MSDLDRAARRMAGWAVVCLLAAVAEGRAEPRAADTPSSTVLLVGRPDARLLMQLRRELAASGFAVVERSPSPDAASPPIAGTSVVVEAEGRRVRVWMSGGADQPPQLRADLTVDRADPHARRRVCLAVVEYLRFGASDAPLAAPGPAPAPPPLPVAGPPPLDLALSAPPPEGRPWGLAAATTVNLDSGIGEPTSHVQLTAQLPLGERWAATVTGLWPLVGAQLQSEGDHVRMWTMGASGGLRYALPRPTPSVRPFVGGGLGVRFVLSDSESIETRQSRVRFTPSAAVGANAGLLLELRPLVHLLLEGHVAWMGMVPLGPRTGYEAAAARGRAAHAAFGVLFEY